jgi:acetyltransferase
VKEFDPNFSNITLPEKTHAATAYPVHLITQIALRDGTALTIRPIRPADMDLEKAFVKNLSDYSRYYRFMQPLRELTPAMLEHFTHQCEFALAIADAWHGKGVGTALMQTLMTIARSVGLESMEGFVLSTNQAMLKLVRFLGFSLETSKDDPTQMTVRKDLLASA